MVLVGSLPRSISKIRKIRVKETRIELSPTWRFYPARLVRFERFVFKETTHTAVPHVDLLSRATRVVTRNVKSDFFRAKFFNIFYIFGREKISISSIRAPIKPRKFPLKHLEKPQKHIEFSTSDVFLPLYWAKKRGESPVFRALSSSLEQRYNKKLRMREE